MSNEEYLRKLIESFPELVEPLKTYQGFIFFGILFSIVAAILLIYVIIHIYWELPIYDIEDFPAGATIGLIACIIVLVFCFASVGKSHKKYDEEYDQYLNKLETYEIDKAKFDQEQEELFEQRKQYTIYLDGVKVDYNTVLFSQYDCKIIDEDQTIYLTHK